MNDLIASISTIIISLATCLDRQQRMVLILGGIFNLRSNIGAEVLEITQENFRKQLSRAKADLF